MGRVTSCNADPTVARLPAAAVAEADDREGVHVLHHVQPDGCARAGSRGPAGGHAGRAHAAVRHPED
eukprot:7037132-Prymnesium_polylepis.1